MTALLTVLPPIVFVSPWNSSMDAISLENFVEGEV